MRSRRSIEQYRIPTVMLTLQISWIVQASKSAVAEENLGDLVRIKHYLRIPNPSTDTSDEPRSLDIAVEFDGGQDDEASGSQNIDEKERILQNAKWCKP